MRHSYVREFFGYSDMSPADFRELQLKELDMLLYFDKFCKQYGLRYYLAGGTLIGAVRHKGFIPWDEDIDLHMPRPDYEKLPKIWNKYADTERFTLCITTREINFRHNAYAICDNNTTLVEERTMNDDIPQGIRIDIIPLDGVPKNKLKAGIQLFWAMLFAIYNVQRLPENQGGKVMRFGVWLALALVRNPSKRYKLWSYALKQMSKYNFDSKECQYVRELVAPLRSMFILYPREHFDTVVLLDFEDYKLPTHYYYLRYLEKAFGDFMSLPPKEKRVQKTRAVYINLDKGYKEFKGVYYCCKK